MKKKKCTKIIICIFVLFVFVFLITPKFFQNDTLFDIKLGEKYITNGISTSDNFSIHKNLKYTPQHFFVNIISFYVYKAFGFWGLYIICYLLAVVLSLLLYFTNSIFFKRKLYSYIFVFVELLLLINFISLRAQMYSYILFLIEIICIEKYLKNNNKLFLIILSILPLFIINFHAGTIYFYFIVIIVYMLNYIPIKTSKIEYNTEYIGNLKYLFIPLCTGIILIFISPFGVNQIFYGLKTLNNSFINNYVTEFYPLTITSYTGEIFYIYLTVIIISLFYSQKKIKLEHFLFFIGTAFMSLMTVRHTSLFILFSIPCLSYIEPILIKIRDNMYKGITDLGKKVINIFAISIFFTAVFLFGIFRYKALNCNGYLPKSTYPIDSVEYIKTNIGNDKRIFNEYTYGSLLMFNDIKVFIDSRADLYTKEYNKDCTVAEDYIAAITCAGNYEEILTKYNIEYLLIGKDSALAHNIFNDKKYEKIFEDKISYVIKVNK